MLRIVVLALLFSGCAAKQKTYTNGAVAADHILASQAGVKILQMGGNAVDAAVATSFALSVVRPESCGIGGGGFMIIDSPTMDPVALNYRETAPAEVGPDFYETHDSVNGPDASGIPGTVSGLLEAHRTFGTLTRQQVLAPSILLAKHRDNAEQADVLKLISLKGLEGFYAGAVANAIVKATNDHITLEDLSTYRPRWETPLQVDFGDGNTLVSMPPPSSGGVAIAQIIGLLQRVAPESITQNDLDYAQALVESMKHAFADRAEHMADSAFVEVPVSGLLDSVYLDGLADTIQLDATQEMYSYGSVTVPDDDGTSHFCVIDSDGMMVSATETINTHFGSKVIVEPFGFFLNNEMDDFSSPSGANVYGLRQSDKNLPEPGKRPLSSMSPTIIARNGVPFLAIGASGGPRIISAVVQVLLRILWFEDEPYEAVQRTRIHHQWQPNAVYLEGDTKQTHIASHLRKLGHSHLDRKDIGIVQVILVENGLMKPYSDLRKGGKSFGY